MLRNNSRKTESGQALVLIILVMLIALTIGVAVSAQTLINTRQSVADEQSAQAYAAAEAGAEVALKHLKTCTVDCFSSGSGGVGDASYEYDITSASLLNSYIYETRLEKDDVAQIDLSTLTGLTNANNSVRIYFWSEDENRGADMDEGTCNGSPNIAALEFNSLAQNSANSYLIRDKQVFDACAVRSDPNNFSLATAGSYDVDGNDYSYYAKSSNGDYSLKLEPTDKKRLLRIRSWYNTVWVAVVIDSSLTLPNQGYQIISTGTANDHQRTVRVTKTTPYLPAVFDYVLYSGGDLQK